MDIGILVSLVLDVPFISGLGLDSCNMHFSCNMHHMEFFFFFGGGGGGVRGFS